jgi:hypothetical protein
MVVDPAELYVAVEVPPPPAAVNRPVPPVTTKAYVLDPDWALPHVVPANEAYSSSPFAAVSVAVRLSGAHPVAMIVSRLMLAEDASDVFPSWVACPSPLMEKQSTGNGQR